MATHHAISIPHNPIGVPIPALNLWQSLPTNDTPSTSTLAEQLQSKGKWCDLCGKAAPLCSCEVDSQFTQLHAIHHRPLVRFATALVRNEDIARELVNDIFIRLYFRENGGKPFWLIENLEGYLYTAVRFCVHRYSKRLSHRSARFIFLDAGIPYDDGREIELELPDHKLNAEDLLIVEVGRLMARSELLSLIPLASAEPAKVLWSFIEHHCDADSVAAVLSIPRREVMRIVGVAIREIQEAKGLRKTRVYVGDMERRYVDIEKPRNSLQRKRYMRSYQKKWSQARRIKFIQENGPCACGTSTDLFVSWKTGVNPTEHGFNQKTACIWNRTEEAREKALQLCEVVCASCLHAKLSHKRKNRTATNGAVYA